MNKGSYRVIYSGKLAAGHNTEEVAVKLAGLFSLDLNNHAHAAKLAKLVSAKRVVIKQGLTEQAALNYKEAMAKVGALCSIENIQDTTRPRQEQRKAQRRCHLKDRRTVKRSSSILPDRRTTADRRETDKNQE